MSKIYARIEVELELDGVSTSGVQLDLLGLSSVVKEHLEHLPMSGPEMRVLGVAPVTKKWEIEAQLKTDAPFIEPRDEDRQTGLRPQH